MDKKISEKRKEYLSWDAYFMGVAFMSSLRSKDPNTRHGACIVNQKNHIIGTGYNGFPNKCDDDNFSWSREGEENKSLYVIHSEVNAILNAGSSTNDCKMYLFSEKGYYPCNECAKLIIQSGIKEIIMASLNTQQVDQYKTNATLKMFQSAGVKLTVFSDENRIKMQDILKREMYTALNS